MASAAELSRVQLKKRAAQPKVAARQSAAEEDSGADAERQRQIVHEHFLVNMDKWVDELDAADSIRTLSLALTAADLAQLRRSNQHRDEAGDDDDGEAAPSLRQRLDALIEQVDGRRRGCFVKLSSRSAKDVAVGSATTFAVYEQLLAGAGLNDDSEELKCNGRLALLYEAMTRSMRVHSADEALALLAASRRVYWDLKYLAMQPDNSLSLVVREWVDIPLAYEFRAFVYDNRLTAVSQYFTQLHFACLAAERQQLADQLRAFWSRVARHFDYIVNAPDPAHAAAHPGPLVKYVIDFALVVGPQPDDRRWVVLEVNPFNISTGAALFDWAEDADCDVLFGRAPFQFRILDRPVAHTLRNKLHPEWTKRVYQ